MIAAPWLSLMRLPGMPSPVEKKILEALNEFSEVLRSGEPISSRLVVRRVESTRSSNGNAAQWVKKTRRTLKANEAEFANFLGISLKTLKAWEAGERPPPRVACRFMEEVRRKPQLFRSRIKAMTATAS